MSTPYYADRVISAIMKEDMYTFTRFLFRIGWIPIIAISIAMTGAFLWFGAGLSIMLMAVYADASSESKRKRMPKDKQPTTEFPAVAPSMSPFTYRRNPFPTRQCPGCGEHQMHPRLSHCHVCGIRYYL